MISKTRDLFWWCRANALAIGFLLSFPALAAAPHPIDAPVAHRAIYEIGLADATEASGITNAAGRLVFEVSGNPCEGYTMSQRLVVRLDGPDEADRLLDFRVSTYEAGDGEFYRFVSRTYVNERVIEDVKGLAERSADGIHVHLESPEKKDIRLESGALFPSQHLTELLKAARADRRFISTAVYEGAGQGEASDTASAIIGTAERHAADDSLTSGLRGWPVSIAYFSNEKQAENQDFGDQVPSYQMSFILYENGVTRDLVMDYGDYKLSGTLEAIEALEQQSCED